jgi:hypothetical protein
MGFVNTRIREDAVIGIATAFFALGICSSRSFPVGGISWRTISSATSPGIADEDIIQIIIIGSVTVAARREMEDLVLFASTHTALGLNTTRLHFMLPRCPATAVAAL